VHLYSGPTQAALLPAKAMPKKRQTPEERFGGLVVFSLIHFQIAQAFSLVSLFIKEQFTLNQSMDQVPNSTQTLKVILGHLGNLIAVCELDLRAG
jgi:hypothetical protein